MSVNYEQYLGSKRCCSLGGAIGPQGIQGNRGFTGVMGPTGPSGLLPDQEIAYLNLNQQFTGINSFSNYVNLVPQSNLITTDLSSGTLAIDSCNNCINEFDGQFWNRITTKALSFGFSNTTFSITDASYCNYPLQCNISMDASNIDVNSFITLRTNFSFVEYIDTTSPTTSNVIFVSGSMITLNLYEIFNNNNELRSILINSDISSNDVPSPFYGLIDLNVINLYFSGTSPNPFINISSFQETTTPNLYTFIITYNGFDISNNSASYSMNGSIELKCDYGLPIPYKFQFV
jgi:hypothetical protein